MAGSEMMGTGHQISAFSMTLAAGSIAADLGHSFRPIDVAAAGLISALFAAGRLSPDADQTWLSFLGHRRATHRLTVPILALTVGWWFGWSVALAGVPLGWLWHDLGDVLFGRASRRAGRGKGIKIGFWWVGLGLKVNGRLERVVTIIWGVVLLAQCIALP